MEFTAPVQVCCASQCADQNDTQHAGVSACDRHLEVIAHSLLTFYGSVEYESEEGYVACALSQVLIDFVGDLWETGKLTAAEHHRVLEIAHDMAEKDFAGPREFVGDEEDSSMEEEESEEEDDELPCVNLSHVFGREEIPSSPMVRSSLLPTPLS